jgi:hypothetical protein
MVLLTTALSTIQAFLSGILAGALLGLEKH